MSEYNASKEINEAIAAGERALNSLTEADRCIGMARGLGIVDIFGGGGLTSFFKHERMNRAQELVNQADSEIRTFQRELSDVRMASPVSIRFDGLTQFIDIFADNVIVDVLVQSRIAEAHRQIDSAKQSVQYALGRLYEMQGRN